MKHTHRSFHAAFVLFLAVLYTFLLSGTALARTDDAAARSWASLSVQFVGVSEGATLRGTAAIKLAAAGAVQQVAFVLSGAGSARNTERIAPYFFLGDSGGTPYGWDTTKYPNGAYTLTATVTEPSGRTPTATVRFRVENGTQPQLTTQPTASPITQPLPTARPPAAGGPSTLLFGLGPVANSARDHKLAKEAPVSMLTTWYNGTRDLGWMRGWQNSLIPQSYASGKTLHLIVFADGPETRIATRRGTACGRAYPLSDAFLRDMRELAQVWAGKPDDPPLYVTFFTEFQTYACRDNAWNPNSETNTYYLTLKDQYRAAMKIFHETAPNARVSLGWGGWQVRFDQPEIGGGRSMFQHFADVMCESDFQSFQAMESDTNVEDVRQMVDVLNDYGPVMLAHYKPNNSSQATFDRDVRAMLTGSYIAEMTKQGLFAWSFMDPKNLDGSSSTYTFVRDAVRRYGR